MINKKNNKFFWKNDFKILKKIIKILILFLLFFVFYKNSFAVIEKNPENRWKEIEENNKEEEELEEKWKIEASLKTNKKEFDIEENIVVEIIVISKNKQISWNIEVDWINKFDLISQSKTRNFSSDSTWNLFEKISVKLVLKARKSGEYYIGPLKINSEIKTKKKKIIVTWEKLFIWSNNNFWWFLKNKNIPSLNSSLLVKREEATKKREENNEINPSQPSLKPKGRNNIQKNKQGSLAPRKEKIDISDMKTIYLNNDKLYPLPFNISSFIIIFIIIILYFLYKLIDKYLILKIKEEEQKKFKRKKERINFIKLIDELKLEVGNYSKEKFYNKLWEIFRQFLDEKNPKQLSSQSLKELEKILSPKFLAIFKRIYYPEYSPFSDNITERIKILDEFKQLITKK